MTTNNTLFSIAEIQNHSTKNDAWIIVNRKVYNITNYIPDHPGGNAILRYAGKDATTAITIQSAHAIVKNFIDQTLESHHIGNLTQTIMTCFLRYTRHNEPKEPTFLCLGARGVGKTLLLEKIRNPNKPDFIPTIPTTGTNLHTIKLSKKKNSTVTIRELGGALAPLWSQYYSDGDGVIFLIDSSNSFQISASTILFLDMLNHSCLENCPILLVFNKCDLKETVMKLAQIQEAMQLTSILKHAKQKITVIEASALSEHGLQNIRDWIQVNIQPIT